eukprot:SAG11_NODE_6328_length_1335_cov_2.554207_1_plen_26_part_10
MIQKIDYHPTCRMIRGENPHPPPPPP